MISAWWLLLIVPIIAGIAIHIDNYQTLVDENIHLSARVAQLEALLRLPK